MKQGFYSKAINYKNWDGIVWSKVNALVWNNTEVDGSIPVKTAVHQKKTGKTFVIVCGQLIAFSI